jgi:hypothetical protein
MVHVLGPLRHSPSGPKAIIPPPPPPPTDAEFFHVENISFGSFIFTNPAGGPTDESQSTKEITISIGPLPPIDDPASVWDVIANPIPIEGRPLWMDNFSISHVRIQLFRFVPPDVNNPWIPVVPFGCMVADVVLGLSLLKQVPVDGQFDAVVSVDLMFFKRGTPLNLFVIGPP